MPSPKTVLSPKRFQHWLAHPDRACPVQNGAPSSPLQTGASDFTQTFHWRIFRILAEFIDGFDFLAKLKNEVTVFGSARCKPETPEYQKARRLGYLLGKGGYTVITGGGPGAMEAANLGASEAGGESVGLNIILAHEQRINPYVKKAMAFHHFFTRKVMLSASAQAYVFCPGGFGTLDEMSEMLTLIQTEKIPANVPLILLDVAFWKPLVEWVESVLYRHYDYIERDDLKLIHLVDTPEEALAIIKKTKERKFE